MIKICWKRDNYEKVQEYYFDNAEKKIYRICMEQYNAQSKIKMSTGVVFSIGPCVTIIGVLFDDKTVTMNLITLIGSIVFLLVGLYLINKNFNESENRKEEYIRANGVEERQTQEDLKELIRQGRRETIGWLL